ncbi:MAG TPA: SIS domain-containing protein [Candidatus Izemoplasmatales bacterium]|nr:SIS domain-containing protein [Candidatus Izemoplasmatales bacterium]
MTFMDQEMHEEPQRIRQTLSGNAEIVRVIVGKVRNHRIRNIVVAGRGSSDHAATYFKYLCEIVAGIPVGFAAPSVLTVYQGRLDLSDTLTFGVSQSGKAEDVLAVLRHARRQGGLTVSITNDPLSPLALEADHHLNLFAGEEKSIAATKSFVCQMALFALFVQTLTDDQALKSQLDRLPEQMASTLEKKDSISQIAEIMTHSQACYVIGRGYVNAIAHELALKLQETCYMEAMPFSTSDFHHGPFAMLDQDSLVLLLAPNDPSMPDSLELLRKLLPTRAKVIAFTDTPDLPVDTKILLPETSPAMSPFLFVLAGQMLAFDLSLRRGLDPDRPRGLSKVTITR